MALLRKLFARKAMDGLSHVSERVFVFNSCLSLGALDEGAHRDYLTSTIIQLKAGNPHASLMVVNFAAAPTGAGAVHSLLRHGAAAVVTDYPSRYGGYGAAWPALAFAMASLLVYIEEAAPERTTLDAVYGRAPAKLLRACSALDPRPTHLRYLRYVTRLRDKGSLMAMKQQPFVLDCLILRAVPDFDGGGGCRPVVRVHGEPREPSADASSTQLLFSTPRIKQQFKHYKQAESTVIKADIGCQIKGDVVIECIHVGDEDHEEIMFSVMFSTCFLQSNMTVFTLEDIDLPWNCNKEKFQEDFKIEVFFSEVELSDTDESHDESELSSIGNADEFYDFDEILIEDSDFDQDDREPLGEASRQDHCQDPNTNIEHSETRASDSASNSSAEKGEDGETGPSDTDSASNGSDEKGSVGTDDEAEFIHGEGVDVTRETKDPTLGETGYLLEAGSSSSSMPPILPTRRDINEETPTDFRENRSAEGLIPMQKGVHGVTSGVSEVSHSSEGGYGALTLQPMRKTRQKQAAIIPAVPIIRKKMRRTDTGADDKKPATSKTLARVGSQRGALVAASSSSNNSTSQAKTSPSTHRHHEIPNRLKQGSAAQAIRTSNLSKEHLKHSTAIRPEVKQIVLTRQASPSFAPSPLGRERIQEAGECSGNPMEKAKKSVIHSSEKPRSSRAPKQESPVVEAPRRTSVLKKSMSSPAISATPAVSSPGKSRAMASLPGVNTSRPSSGFHIASSSSPRAQKHSVTPPSSPGRLPLAGPRFSRAVPVSQTDVQQGASAPTRLPRRASFSELPRSVATSRAGDVQSLSPKASRVIQNQREGVKGSGRSLSPSLPRLAAQPWPKTTAVVSVSSSKDKRSGTAPARPTRLSS
ncbi:formin-like protein 20 [Hordeum vulgare subsp. vulgare]|uniref:formin-like protein 20 n=1 Tax=Hordeum vulgare subsp. vulgare TaxID=112509 RepID=UPI001D1A4304|nr:formin-like protein 20 [Hordeum vulgare subsp. vulgare]